LRFSLRLNNDHPVSTYVEIAQIAEEAGFDQFWVSDDLFLRSAPVILAAVALATHRIEIGTCILNPYTINPAEIAMISATLDELSGGRFNLGLSSGAAGFLQWVGINPHKPRTAVVEAVNVINRLLSCQNAPCDGDTLKWGEEAYLRFTPQRRVPIYIGAMSPNMLRTIGMIADGGLPLLFPPEHYENIIPYIVDGIKNAERDLDDIDVAACIWCSVSHDQEAAVDALREKIAYYGHAMSPLILNQLELVKDDFSEIERAMMIERDVEKAKSLVTAKMLRIGVTGTPDDLIVRLEKLVEMGVTHLSFGPPLGPDLAEAVRLIGKEVIPHFRENS
jgi:5,10-methylenetetrahydromethanopterin reductase